MWGKKAKIFESLFLFCTGTLIFASATHSQAFEHPPFLNNQKLYVPTDIQTLAVHYIFDVASKTITAEATVNFKVSQKGYPLIDLVPEPTALSVDGKTLTAASAFLVQTPKGETQFRAIDLEMEKDSEHTARYEFTPSRSEMKVDDHGAKFLLHMTDLSDRSYLEGFAPSNWVYDSFKFDLEVEVRGSQLAHRVFANGTIEEMGNEHWKVTYPSYFRAASPYFHLTYSSVSVHREMYDGTETRFPIEIYVPQELNSLLPSIAQSTRNDLKELEETYGPFCHDKLLIYVYGKGTGGMEYSGATETGLGSLSHELSHSWFARGLMPANGNAGWIDEAFASWRDAGYPTASAPPSRAKVNLAALAPYNRVTPGASYSAGAQFLSELDFLFKQQSLTLKTVLRELYLLKNRQAITTEEFEIFLQDRMEANLTPLFERYVYGRASLLDKENLFEPPPFTGLIGSPHHRVMMAKEIEAML